MHACVHGVRWDRHEQVPGERELPRCLTVQREAEQGPALRPAAWSPRWREERCWRQAPLSGSHARR